MEVKKWTAILLCIILCTGSIPISCVIRAEIEGLYEKYPKVLGVFDTETAKELTKEGCAALIKVMELRNKLTDMERQLVYFRGCYDSVGYLKKARIL